MKRARNRTRSCHCAPRPGHPQRCATSLSVRTMRDAWIVIVFEGQMPSGKRPLQRAGPSDWRWRTVEQAACEQLTPCRPLSLPTQKSARQEKADLYAAATALACRGPSKACAWPLAAQAAGLLMAPTGTLKSVRNCGLANRWIRRRRDTLHAAVNAWAKQFSSAS